jgi:hypothetical protein
MHWVLRLAAFTLGGLWCLVAGVAGSVLLGAWLFTDHVFWYGNLNLLQVNPLFLLLLPAFVLHLFADRFPGWGIGLTRILAVVSVLGLMVALLPGLGPHNAEILALTLPLNLGLALGVGMLGDGKLRERGETGTDPTFVGEALRSPGA